MKDRTNRRGLPAGLESLIIACSMYSGIPMPQVEWSEGGMRYALCFFPVVGVIIGALMVLFDRAGRELFPGSLAYACIGTAIPLLVTGGIHMDGFLDTVDARSSHQSRERKLAILKDPHTGAFAIIGCGVYLLLYLAVLDRLGAEAFPAAAGIYVLVRALSGLSVVWFPKARKDGLASQFAAGARPAAVRIVLVVWAVLSVLYIGWFGGMFPAAVLAVTAGAVFFWYYRMAMQEFGGMTGDLAGYFLQVSELVLLAALAVCMWAG